MTPERMAELVARWVRFYTRSLPPGVAERRIEEIDADVHDHIEHERAQGIRDRRIALGIASRMARGLAADASWRGRMQRRASMPIHRSVVRVLLVTACILLVPLVLMQVDDGTNWSTADFVIAGVLLAGSGLLLELAVRQPRNIVVRAVTIAIGVAAMVLGNADDAPGLVLFGCLLVLGTVGLAVRAALRS
jgi:hypothetical protein